MTHRLDGCGRPAAARRIVACLAVAGGLEACATLEQLPDRLFDSRTPRERYEAGLTGAGLGRSALFLDWTEAARRALEEAPTVTPPHVEEGYLSPAEPAALSLRVAVRRGQEVAFGFELVGDSTTTLFIEAWQPSGDSTAPFSVVAVADSGQRELTLTPRRDAELVIRAQPELLRGGRFRMSVAIRPMLAFPVRGGREQDVWSRFGAPRDGGARDHHGIDIFMPRGTVALAAAAGYVSRVETTPRGGNVVWVRDPRGFALYYAHLDRQHVAEGMEVEPGDTIGFVGNTGNAIRSRPHLHFGVYQRGEGPVDPWWFVHRPRGSVARLAADTGLLGSLARTSDATMLRGAPGARADTLLDLPRFTPLRVLAATGAWYRVRLPDGSTGYLASTRVEPASRAVETTRVAVAQAVLAKPASVVTPDVVMAQAAVGESVDVLGRFGGYRLVRVGGGVGWVTSLTIDD